MRRVPQTRWIRRLTSVAVACLIASSCTPPRESAPPPDTYTLTRKLVGPLDDEYRVAMAQVDSTFFAWPSIGEAFVGRTFQPDEYERSRSGEWNGERPVLILTHGFWEASYGADPSVVGRWLLVGGIEHVIVGVMAPGVVGPEGAEIFLPGGAAELSGTAVGEPAPDIVPVSEPAPEPTPWRSSALVTRRSE